LRSALLLVLASVAACARGGGGRPDVSIPYAPALGEYEFLASIPGTDARGTVLVTADTFFVKESQSCGLMQSSFTEIRLACRGGGIAGSPGQSAFAILKFNRRSPGLSASWEMQVSVPRQRETCVRTEVRNGRETCIERRRETYYVTERTSGTVQVRKVTPPST
jgi:hypothetical protein